MRFALVPRADSRLVLEEEVRNDAVRYHPRMQRLGLLARRFGFDVLIVVAAIESTIEVATQGHEVGGPSLSTWLAVPALWLVILPLLARRRFRSPRPP